MGVTHTPKAGARLTGTEYEAADSHILALADGDIPSTIARDSEVTAAISALSSVYQPLDSDLTSIAALTTTAFGRGLLALADAAALRTSVVLPGGIYDVRWNGAACDGTTDDTTAIAAAITAASGAGGGIVWIPSDTVISATLAVPDGVFVRGAGADRTQIIGAAGMTASMIVMQSRCLLADISVSAPSSMTDDAVVIDEECLDTKIERVRIFGASGTSGSVWSLSIRSAYRWGLRDVYVDTYGNGIHVVDTAGAFNYGNARMDHVEVWTRSASRTGVKIIGNTKSQNLLVATYLGILCPGAAASGSVGLHLVRCNHATFVLADLENHATSLLADTTLSRDVTFVGLYASKDVTLDSVATSWRFLGGKIEGTITDGTSGPKAARFIDTLDVNNNPIQSANLLDRTVTVQFVIDGGGSEIADGVHGDLMIDFPCVIESVTALADQAGDIVVDIWSDPYGSFPPTDADSITASAPVTITSPAAKSQDTTLTGWTTTHAAGDILRFNVDSCTTITRCTIALKVRRY